MIPLYIPPCSTMPMGLSSGPKNSFSPLLTIYSIAAGSLFSYFSRSCTKDAGGSTTRAVSRLGLSSASCTVNSGRLLSVATKLPYTWQLRIRTSSMTGVFDASDRANAWPTAAVIDGRLGRGSSSHICDFIAKAWLRSCIIELPSP